MFSTANLAALLQLARSPVAWARVMDSPRPPLEEERHGRGTTPCRSGDIDRYHTADALAWVSMGGYDMQEAWESSARITKAFVAMAGTISSVCNWDLCQWRRTLFHFANSRDTSNDPMIPKIECWRSLCMEAKAVQAILSGSLFSLFRVPSRCFAWLILPDIEPAHMAASALVGSESRCDDSDAGIFEVTQRTIFSCPRWSSSFASVFSRCLLTPAQSPRQLPCSSS